IDFTARRLLVGALQIGARFGGGVEAVARRYVEREPVIAQRNDAGAALGRCVGLSRWRRGCRRRANGWRCFIWPSIARTVGIRRRHHKQRQRCQHGAREVLAHGFLPRSPVSGRIPESGLTNRAGFVACQDVQAVRSSPAAAAMASLMAARQSARFVAAWAAWG